MNTNTEDFIDSKIENIIKENNIYHVGKVVRINSFIVEATGLEDAFFFEKVFIGDGNNVGYVDKIEENKVFIALVRTDGNIKIGDSIKTTGEALQAGFSKNAMGMVVDAFGVDRITGKSFNESKMIPIETEKIPIMDRTAVNRPLETGIASIDLMFPIGRGQRQLIIGDKKTGKTQILLDTIVNQKGKNVICIYVSIGKTKKEVKRLYSKLVEKGANAYTQIVAVFNDDTSPLIKLTPYVGLSVAEKYMREGYDVLVCIDDLKKHADACREIALISEKNTGREAYPADIFYTHSRLLEKGCQYKNGGSITILPVVETKGGDITDYISTNIISITDGQIVLSEKNFKKGQKPALDFGLSVSRLGGAVQKESIKKVGAAVRRELLTYLETADVYQLVKVDAMSKELQEKVFRGKKLLELLKQPKFSPRSEEKLVQNFSFILQEHSIGEDVKVEEEKDIINNENDNNDNNNSGMTNLSVEDNSVTENNVSEGATKIEVPTENIVTEEVAVDPVQVEQVVPMEVAQPEMVTQEVASEPVQVEQVVPMEVAQPEMVTQEVAVEPVQVEQVVPMEVAQPEMVTQEVASEPVQVEQVVSMEVAQPEMVTQEVASEPVQVEQVVPMEVAQPEMVAKEVAVDPVQVEQVVPMEVAQPEMVTQEVASEPVQVESTIENDFKEEPMMLLDTLSGDVPVMTSDETLQLPQVNYGDEKVVATEEPVMTLEETLQLPQVDYGDEKAIATEEPIMTLEETLQLPQVNYGDEKAIATEEPVMTLEETLQMSQLNDNNTDVEQLYTTDIPVEEIKQFADSDVEQLYTTELPIINSDTYVAANADADIPHFYLGESNKEVE